MNTVPCLTILFDTPLKKQQVPQFRGAIASKVENILFRNHGRLAYPLVQYKSIKELAVMQFLGEGVNNRNDFFLQEDWRFINLGGEDCKLKIKKFEEIDYRPLLSEDCIYHYQIESWIPFRDSSSKNYKNYKTTPFYIDRLQILEHILGGNILSFIKGCGQWLNLDHTEKVTCKILSILGSPEGDWKTVKPKIPKMPVFRLQFASNVQLPTFIGLGNHVRVGNGVISPLTSKKQTKKHSPSYS